MARFSYRIVFSTQRFWKWYKIYHIVLTTAWKYVEIQWKQLNWQILCTVLIFTCKNRKNIQTPYCKKKGKRNFPRFRIWPGQTSYWWDNYCAVQKFYEYWKENIRAWLKKLLRNYALRWNLTFIETKDFKIQFPWRNKWPRHYNILQMKVGCEKWQILLVSRNPKPRKLSGVFCFYFRTFFFLHLFNKATKLFLRQKVMQS